MGWAHVTTCALLFMAFSSAPARADYVFLKHRVCGYCGTSDTYTDDDNENTNDRGACDENSVIGAHGCADVTESLIARLEDEEDRNGWALRTAGSEETSG